MFDSDEDEFQHQCDPARVHRMLQKKQRKTPASQQKRRLSAGTPHSSQGAAAAKKTALLSDSGSSSRTGSRGLSYCSHQGLSSVTTARMQSTGAQERPTGVVSIVQETATQALCGDGQLVHEDGPLDKPESVAVSNCAAGKIACSSSPQQHSQGTTAAHGSMRVASGTVAVPSITCSPEHTRPASRPCGLDNPQGQQPLRVAHSVARSVLPASEAEGQVAQGTCPVCGVCLSSISITEAGRLAHVNACLDAASAAMSHATAATQWPAQSAAANASIEALGQAAEQQIKVVDDEDDHIGDWLASIGASEVLVQFQAAEVDLSVLPHLNDGDLQEMGVDDAMLRQKILAAATAQCQQPAACSGAAGQLGGYTQAEYGADEQRSQCDDGMFEDWDDQHLYDDENLQQADASDEQQWEQPAAAAACGCITSATANAGPDKLKQQQQQGPFQQQLRPPLQQVQQNVLSTWQGSSSTSGCAQQSSIRGWLQKPSQQQFHSDTGQPGAVPLQHEQQNAHTRIVAKQQWQELFAKPARILGPPQPLLQQQGKQQQQRLGHQGQLLAPSVSGQQQQEQQQVHQLVPVQVQPGQCTIISRSRTADLPRWWPAWRRLPGTNIVVDCFGQSSKSIGNNRTWILSHFHADHYMGLSKGFKQGKILCTPITAALVRLKLRVPADVLLPVELGQEVMVEGTRMQLIDANHCPGAAMVVAHPPGGQPPVLHTGDARLTAAARQQPVLQALVGKAVLVLDTTYADPTYCFPPQQQVLDWVLKAVKAESFNPRTLFLFGSYTIGKERLFLHVASALKAKVYVAAAKRAVMGAVNLPPEQAALLTTNHLEANIHVVPMRQVSLSEMESLLVRYKGRYTAVVGFQPTGWAQGGAGGGGKQGEPSRSSSTVRPSKRLQRGTVVMYKVPYSEHSSCAELREFVSWFKPIQIIPSVSNDNGPKLKQMLAAVTSSGKVTGPMDGWARRPQQQQQHLVG